MVVGERSLGDKMKQISKQANLSKMYTNHSIRATAVTILDKSGQSGFEARHIMAVSGHKDESSLRSYCTTDFSTKREMSASLSTECTASEHNLSRNQLSPILSLCQEEFILQTTHTESRKSETFNFQNCSVNFFPVSKNTKLIFQSLFLYNDVISCECRFVIMSILYIYFYQYFQRIDNISRYNQRTFVL